MTFHVWHYFVKMGPRLSEHHRSSWIKKGPKSSIYAIVEHGSNRFRALGAYFGRDVQERMGFPNHDLIVKEWTTNFRRKIFPFLVSLMKKKKVNYFPVAPSRGLLRREEDQDSGVYWNVVRDPGHVSAPFARSSSGERGYLTTRTS